MSDVISFRLSNGKPREAKALQVLLARRADGYSVRHILTEALLRLADSDSATTKSAMGDLNETLSQMSKLLSEIRNGNYSSIKKPEHFPTSLDLSDNFIESIKKVVKPGLKSE